MAILISLPESYSSLVTALETKGDDLTLEFVKQALISEEQKRRLNTNGDMGNRDSALQAHKAGYKPRYG